MSPYVWKYIVNKKGLLEYCVLQENLHKTLVGVLYLCSRYYNCTRCSS